MDTPLDDIEHLCNHIRNGELPHFQKEPIWQMKPRRCGSLYCPHCGDRRAVELSCLFIPSKEADSSDAARQKVRDSASPGPMMPSLHQAECLQCRTTFTLLIYRGARGAELAVFPSVDGGIRTPHTPETVAYYLDQAHRAKNVGARSAAAAMYRAALEHLLVDQGYTNGTCGPKISALERDSRNMRFSSELVA